MLGLLVKEGSEMDERQPGGGTRCLYEVSALLSATAPE